MSGYDRRRSRSPERGGQGWGGRGSGGSFGSDRHGPSYGGGYDRREQYGYGGGHHGGGGHYGGGYGQLPSRGGGDRGGWGGPRYDERPGYGARPAPPPAPAPAPPAAIAPTFLLLPPSIVRVSAGLDSITRIADNSAKQGRFVHVRMPLAPESDFTALEGLVARWQAWHTEAATASLRLLAAEKAAGRRVTDTTAFAPPAGTSRLKLTPPGAAGEPGLLSHEVWLPGGDYTPPAPPEPALPSPVSVHFPSIGIGNKMFLYAVGRLTAALLYSDFTVFPMHPELRGLADKVNYSLGSTRRLRIGKQPRLPDTASTQLTVPAWSASSTAAIAPSYPAFDTTLAADTGARPGGKARPEAAKAGGVHETATALLAGGAAGEGDKEALVVSAVAAAAAAAAAEAEPTAADTVLLQCELPVLLHAQHQLGRLRNTTRPSSNVAGPFLQTFTPLVGPWFAAFTASCVAASKAALPTLSPDDWVIHVRTGDVWREASESSRAINDAYAQPPAWFYQWLVRRYKPRGRLYVVSSDKASSLTGGIVAALEEALGASSGEESSRVNVVSATVHADLGTLIRARTLVPSTSTFAWWGAFLSQFYSEDSSSTPVPSRVLQGLTGMAHPASIHNRHAQLGLVSYPPSPLAAGAADAGAPAVSRSVGLEVLSFDVGKFDDWNSNREQQARILSRTVPSWFTEKHGAP